MPVVDAKKCNGCGLCLAVCGCEALVLSGNVIKVIETEKCGWCIECEAVCPTGAIACAYEIVTEG